MRRLVVLLVVALALLAPVTVLCAETLVSPSSVVLEERGADTFVATVELENRGDRPLRIERVTTKDLPLGMGLSSRGRAIVIEPGQRASIEVTWIPSMSHARELAGHLLVETDSGVRPIGVVAQQGSTFDWIVLSLIVWLPLFGIFGATRRMRAYVSSSGAMAASFAFSCFAIYRFRPGLGVDDAHGGFQLVERVPLAFGIEYHLGVDGLSLPLVVTAGLVFLAAALRSEEADPLRRASLHLGATGVLGALVTLDAALFVFFFGLIWAAATLHARRGLVALAGVLSTALVAVALSQLVAQGTVGHLIDGTTVERSLSFVELSRVPWLERDVGVVARGFVLAFAGFAVAMPLFGLHGWLRAALATGAHHALVGKVALYGLVRIGLGITPEAARWAAPMLAAIAAASIVASAIAAARVEGRSHLSALASVAQSGLALLALASLTPVGIEACLLLLVGDALARAIFAWASWLPSKAALAIGSAAALPWGPILALVGAAARHPVATAIACLGWVALIVVHLRYDDPGAKASPRSRLASGILVAGAALLALYPRPLTWWMDRSALDLHRRLDPPDGAQIAGVTGAGASEPTAVACAPREPSRPSG